ncbi:hypothetical protein ABW20_dc0101244 [Dactylellina cionopaga]|nr:hypothetical protein ABW20_dc0101244 [Dactylellina cionopaga]
MSSIKTLDDSTSISNWSIAIPPKPLPPADQIKRICVIDFDNSMSNITQTHPLSNALYQSPIPSNIWERPSIGILKDKDHLLGGGWWQTPSILEATIAPDGASAAAAQGSQFPDRWNKRMVEVAHQAEKDPQTFSVLLTGRNRTLFSKTILSILDKGRVGFNLVVLKQNNPDLKEEFSTTMEFKQYFLVALLNYFHNTEKINIYDDRFHHAKQFREFGEMFNRDPGGKYNTLRKIKFDVQHVQPMPKNLDPLEEIKQVKFMLQRHNLIAQSINIDPRPPPAQLFKRVHNTSYMISPETTSEIFQRFPIRSKRGSTYTELYGRYLRTKIGKCDPLEIERLGGMGTQVQFEPVSFGSYNDCIWALRVRAVKPAATSSTFDGIHTILLAKKIDIDEAYISKIEHWEEIRPGNPRYFIFSGTLGEQIRLQIAVTRVKPPQGFTNPSYRRWRASDSLSDQTTLGHRGE